MQPAAIATQKFATAIIDRYIFAVLERHNFLFYGDHNLLRRSRAANSPSREEISTFPQWTNAEQTANGYFHCATFVFVPINSLLVHTHRPQIRARYYKSRSKPRDHKNTAIKLPGQFEVQFLDGTPSLVNLKCFTSERYANATFRSISFQRIQESVRYYLRSRLSYYLPPHSRMLKMLCKISSNFLRALFLNFIALEQAVSSFLFFFLVIFKFYNFLLLFQAVQWNSVMFFFFPSYLEKIRIYCIYVLLTTLRLCNVYSLHISSLGS